jgi:hypothetical protein
MSEILEYKSIFFFFTLLLWGKQCHERNQLHHTKLSLLNIFWHRIIRVV